MTAAVWLSIGSITASCLALTLAQNLRGAQDLCRETPVIRCSCSEMLLLGGIENQIIDIRDVQTGFRKASIYCHPDRKRGTDVSDETFIHLTWCRDYTLNKGNRKYYFEQLREKKERATQLGWPMNRVRDGIEDWHLALQHQEKVETTHTPRNAKRANADAEVLHVFVDSSTSMTGEPAAHAEEVLKGVMPRILRTPTNFHVIGSNWEKHNGASTCLTTCETGKAWGDGFAYCAPGSCKESRPVSAFAQAGPQSHRLFGEEDDFMLEDVMPKWNMTAKGTYLWQYVFKTLQEQNGNDEHEVIIITDGYDTESDGVFNGWTGYNALMEQLKDSGKQLPRFIVRFVGTWSEEGNSYRDLALASGGFFAGGSGDDANKEFIAYAQLPHYARARKSVEQKRQYEGLLEAGKALALPWYDSLSIKV